MPGLGESMEEKQQDKFPDVKEGATERFLMPSCVEGQQTILGNVNNTEGGL